MTSDKTKSIIAGFRKGNRSALTTAQRLYFVAENAPRARTLLRGEYSKTQQRELLEWLGNLYYQSGQTLEAEMAYLATLTKHRQIHAANLIALGYPAAAAMVDHKRKVLYIPIPKCASSSVKNFLAEAIVRQQMGEAVHREFNETNCIVTPAELTSLYRGYFKFAVIRDPLERVASYYSRNLRGGALKRKAFGQDQCLGLATEPDLSQFLADFESYFQQFLDFRHHVAPMVGYLWPFAGQDPEFKLFTMAGVGQLRADLSEIYGRDLAPQRAMASQSSPQEWQETLEALAPLREFYDEDYRAFGPALRAPLASGPLALDQKIPAPNEINWLPMAGTQPIGAPRLHAAYRTARKFLKRIKP